MLLALWKNTASINIIVSSSTSSIYFRWIDSHKCIEKSIYTCMILLLQYFSEVLAGRPKASFRQDCDKKRYLLNTVV